MSARTVREILFRGKRTFGGEWIYGFYFTEKEKGSFIKELPSSVFNATCLVNPETVGQFTGLFDSAGRRIFENDILRLTCKADGLKWIAVVKFGNPNGEYNWGFQLVKINGDGVNTDILLWVETDGAYAEIVGNIYDNPELLEGDQCFENT